MDKILGIHVRPTNQKQAYGICQDEITVAPEVVSALAGPKDSLSVDDLENLFADMLPEREQRTEEEVFARILFAYTNIANHTVTFF